MPRARAAEVVVVDGHRLLEHGVVGPERMEPLHHGRQVGHVAAPDEARGVGQTVGMPIGWPSGGAAPRNWRRRTTRPPAAPPRAAARRRAPPRPPAPACRCTSVSRRHANERVHSVTFSWASAGSTQHTSASLFAPSLHGNELHVLQRTQPPSSPGLSSPSGSGAGRRPIRRISSTRRCMPGACGTAGCGNGPRGGSVGSTPASPRTP